MFKTLAHCLFLQFLHRTGLSCCIKTSHETVERQFPSLWSYSSGRTMDAERTLIQATVVGVNDSNILWHCIRCNITCNKSQLMWRYRLSLCLADSSASCHVSLFGGTLAQHFGCPASDFQRFLSGTYFQGEPLHLQGEVIMHSLAMALVGKSFLFGLKLPVSQVSMVTQLSQQQHLAGSTICLADLLARQTTTTQLHDGKVSDFVAVQMIPAGINLPSSRSTVLDVLKQLCSQNANSSSDHSSLCDSASTGVARTLTRNYSARESQDSGQNDEPHISQNLSTLSLKSDDSTPFCSFLHKTQSTPMFSCDSSMERDFAWSQRNTRNTLSDTNEWFHSPFGSSSLTESLDKPTQSKSFLSENSLAFGASTSSQYDKLTHHTRSKSSMSSAISSASRIAQDLMDETLEPETHFSFCRKRNSFPLKSPVVSTIRERDSLRESPHSTSCEILRCQSEPKVNSLLDSEDVSFDTTFSSSLNDSSLLLAAVQEDPDRPVHSCSRVSKTISQRECTPERRESHFLTCSKSTETDETVHDGEHARCPHCLGSNSHSKMSRPGGCICDTVRLERASASDTNQQLQSRVGVEHIASDLTVDMPDSEDLSLFLDVMALEAAADTAISTENLTKTQTATGFSSDRLPAKLNIQMFNHTEEREKPSFLNSRLGTKIVVCDKSIQSYRSKLSRDSIDTESGIPASFAAEQKSDSDTALRNKSIKASDKVTGDRDHSPVLNCTQAKKNVTVRASNKMRTPNTELNRTPVGMLCKKEETGKSSPYREYRVENSAVLHDYQFEDSTLSPTLLEQAFSSWCTSQHELSAVDLSANSGHQQQLDIPDSEDLCEFLNKVSGESEHGTETQAVKQDGELQEEQCDKMKARQNASIGEEVTAVTPHSDSTSPLDCSNVLDGSAELFFSQSQSCPTPDFSVKRALLQKNDNCSTIPESSRESDEHNFSFKSPEKSARKCLQELQNSFQEADFCDMQCTPETVPLSNEGKNPKKREKQTPEMFGRKKVRFSRRKRVSTVHAIDYKLEKYSTSSPVPGTPLKSCLQTTRQSSRQKHSAFLDRRKVPPESDIPHCPHPQTTPLRPESHSQFIQRSPWLFQTSGSQDLFSPCSDGILDNHASTVTVLAGSVHKGSYSAFPAEGDCRRGQTRGQSVIKPGCAEQKNAASPVQQLFIPNPSGRLANVEQHSPTTENSTVSTRPVQGKQNTLESRHSLLFNSSDALFDDSNSSFQEQFFFSFAERSVGHTFAGNDIESCDEINVGIRRCSERLGSSSSVREVAVYPQISMLSSSAAFASPDLFSP
ncbi:hypothetical protein BaRGS_00012319 [Batillaria attramentaria]|uniref:Replication factor A C-terminal domain-containing protein n=1 Tax=Batillaria attramentaria TaxID=370345 RepID=A0ABD0LA59_9CAEN